ncbi:MAG: tRNA pseudouridine(13) synthase TruD [Crenarchaeota archaeon]|nr:tRNA pseudouridine(13) synthase TruD [Thermoproteota archaeon]
MASALDHICGIHKYSTDSTKAVYAELHCVDDFIVEEILKDGTIISVDDPKLRPSGYPGLFTHFILVKRNMDTLIAIKILSKRLNVPSNFFFLSGLKDKEALTAQRACVFNVPPENLVSLKLPKNMKIYNPIRELRRISVGDHQGNRFRIRLRNVLGCLEDVFHEIVKEPILNFFGHQRFGIWKPINHIVGKMILLGLYEEALMTFLREVNPLFPNREAFIDLLEERKYGDALKLLPARKFWLERLVLRGLTKGVDPIKILRYMPQGLLRLVVEAYQSFLFNLLLSELEDPPRKLPLVGHKLNLETLDSKTASAIKEILDGEGISPKDFKVTCAKLEISRGGFRVSRILLKDPALREEGGRDYLVMFSLPKGSFATIVLREIAKENLVQLLLGRRKSSSIETARIFREMNNYYLAIVRKYFVGSNLQNFTV